MTIVLTFDNRGQRAKLMNPLWKVKQIFSTRVPIVRINENAGQVNS